MTLRPSIAAPIPDARIDDAVGDVGEQIGRDDHGGREEQDAEDGRVPECRNPVSTAERNRTGAAA